MSNTRSVVRLSDDSIVIQPKIHRMFLTEDRLKNILSRIYEDGVIDSNNFGWNNLGTTLLAVSGTLLLACLTSKFNDFSKYIEWATPTVLSIIAWVIFTVFFIEL